MVRAADLPPTRAPVRVGILGLGRAALGTHVPALAAMRELYTVVAVCDLIKERRAQVARLYPEVRPYRRCEDMLDDPEIDLVLVALPSGEHVPAALGALARGKWTVLESPIALTHDQALVLKAAAVKARGKLFPCLPGLFAPEFLLARQMMTEARLGAVYEVIVRRQDYLRRDDWQALVRCGGGAVWHTGPETVQQALQLLGGAPAQLWGEFKRIAAVGDADDTFHLALKGRGAVTVYVDVGGGRLDAPQPAFEIRGDRGAFAVYPGAAAGTLRYINPSFVFRRRRAAVRTPPLADRHEKIPVLESTVPCDRAVGAAEGFWRALHASVCRAQPFAAALDEAVEAIRYLQALKRQAGLAN